MASGVAAAAGHGEGAATVGSHAVLQAVLEVESNPDAPGVVVTLTSAFLAFLLAYPLRFLATHATTAIHEGAHLFFAVWGGSKVDHIHINRDSGGVTQFSPLPVVDDVLASAAGYLAPSVVGLGLADLLAHGWSAAVLWSTAAWLVFLQFFPMNAFGRVYVALLTGVFVLLALKAGPEMVLFAACTWAWYLMSDGMIKILVIWRRATDYDFLPLLGRSGWAVVNLFLSIASMIWGGLLLVGAQEPFL